MYLRLPIGILLYLVIGNVSASTFLFSPKNCDFSVEFPNEYKIRELSLGGSQALGAASGRGAGNTRFGAECWRIERKMSIEEIGRGLEEQAKSRGMIISSNIIDKDDKNKVQVIVSGILTTDGKKIHAKLISILGKTTRLDLSIVDSELLKQSHVDFRNSVKLK
jgi:hypothetical protein